MFLSRSGAEIEPQRREERQDKTFLASLCVLFRRCSTQVGVFAVNNWLGTQYTRDCYTHSEANIKGLDMDTIKDKVRQLALEYANQLQQRISQRVADMKEDDKSHFLVYRVLGVTDEEGNLIDMYQNKGRFLYRYAGAFLENAAKLCFQERYPDAASLRIPNTQGRRPKTFEIDCLVENDAIEIKWRDATTDGDHITKEHTRIKVIKEAGFKPFRIMFFYPNREQAIRIQQTLETLYAGMDGEYHYGDDAWEYVLARTGVDLRHMLEKLAEENTRKK